MAGSDAIRGFVIQGIISILESVEIDNWNSIKVEPQTDKDKVDIAFYNSGRVIKAIQVKSSINKFEAPSICEWIEKMIEDVVAVNYELFLVGEVTNPGKKYINKFESKNIDIFEFRDTIKKKIENNHSSIEVRQFGFNEKQMWIRLKQSILGFMDKHCPEDKINNRVLEVISNNMLSYMIRNATGDKVISKEEFLKILINIVKDSSKSNENRNCINSISRKIVYSTCLIIFVILFIKTMQLGSIEMFCVLFFLISLVILIMLGYKSNREFEKVAFEKNYVTHKSEGCNLIDIIISQNNLIGKQEVMMENKLTEKIKIIRGILTFYNENLNVHQIEFCLNDIDSGRKEYIERLNENETSDFFHKTRWNEVKLDIREMITDKGKEYNWKGTIISFIFTYYAILNCFNYWKIIGIRIPVEITWLTHKVKECYSIVIAILKTKRLCYGKISISEKIKCWIIVNIRKLIVVFILALLIFVIIISAVGLFFIVKECISVFVNLVN